MVENILAGVENTVWFAVTSEEPPKPNDAFYNLNEISPKDFKFTGIERGALEGYVKYYMVTTHQAQLETLSALFEQYGMHLIFYGFTILDTDFSEYGLSRIPR